jgi:AAA ATPase domain
VDPVSNPYTPNAGSRPSELAGREGELRQFEILVARLKRGTTDQSLIVKGLRGVGKTVLLNSFEDLAEAQGFLTYYHELTPDSSLLDNLVRDAESALARLKLSERAGRRVREALGGLRTIKLTGPAGFGLQVELRDASEGTITTDLTELFLELGRAARDKESGIAFFLDEVQFVEEVQYRSMISALHRSTQKQLPITVAAAGLPQIPRLSGEARSYAERLFDFPTIASLSEEDARGALAGPAAKLGVEYSAEAIAAALEWTEGYPFYIQQLGKHAWNLAEASPIGLEVVREAMPAAQAALDRSIYEVRIQRATANEQRYMRAMADLGAGPYRSGAVAKQLGKPASSLSPVRQQLLSKGLIYSTEDYGYIDFTVPRFDEYMRRSMPFRAARKASAKKR